MSHCIQFKELNAELELELIKKIKRFSDDDIFILISCYENKDWGNKNLSSLLSKNNVL